MIHGWAPEFIVTVGDNFYDAPSSIDADIGQYYQDYIYPYRGSYGPGATVNKFWPVLGNHDWGNTYPNPTGDQAYLNYFTLPNNGRYYDFVRGPVHFFALDSDANEPDGNTSTSVQAQWLKSRLAAATEPWKVVYFHHSPYASDSDSNDIAPNMRWPFQQWGANIVLTGHSHYFERLNINGFPYIIDGLGGDPEISLFGPPIDGSQVRYSDDFGAMKADADAKTLTFRFYTRAGLLIDTYGMSNDPLIPTSLTAAAGNGEVSLTWSAAPAATSYNVKRATASGGPYSLIMSGVTGASYIDNTVTNGTTYYYVVTGVNATSESQPSNEASATPNEITRINCGGSQYVSGSGLFQADTFFQGGTAEPYSDRPIANTSDPQLYLTHRTGTSFSYNIPVTNGSYVLRLYFAECSYTAAGQREFNVNVNGSAWLTNFDIFATAGAANTAVIMTTPITVSGRQVKLDFVSQLTGVNAVAQAIEILPASSGALSLNCGGGDLQTSEGLFSADSYFTGGTAEPYTSRPIAGTADPQLYLSHRTGSSFSYTIPVSNGSYQVKLYFAECSYSGPGQRLFNVNLNGAPWLTNFDIFSAAGGANTAVVVGTSTVVSGGQVKLEFTSQLTGVNAVVQGIQIAPAPTTPIPVRINCGGGQYTSASGTVFAADAYFQGGTGEPYSSRPIANTQDPQLYLTHRTGTSFSYSIPVANGTYTLKLYFAECSYTSAGQRNFNVSVNGSPWLAGFDIFAAAGGANTAVIETTTVTVTNSVVKLDFASQLSGVNAVVQAIELVPQ